MIERLDYNGFITVQSPAVALRHPLKIQSIKKLEHLDLKHNDTKMR